ncbi:MAG: phospholipid carrier-dependent glycosyltransferase [Oscillospiraceae bacterium]|nr:phospholipid carrier-dependent glycosyltransferase [Oscillospiraceae bacterium]
MKSSYLFPILAALLIVLFYLGLPELKTCALPPAERGRRGGPREGAFLALLTLAYAALAFFRLGDAQAPQSFRAFEGDSLTLELAEPAPVGGLTLYTGVVPGSYIFELSPDGEVWLPAGEYSQGYADLLKWQTPALTAPELPVRYLRVTGYDGAELGELALLGPSGEALPWLTASELTDEQALVPPEPDYLNSCYFDEIYHARTAVEHLRGMRPYEISHPPLGKLLIGLGIRLFGQTPFGWRFMGTLFGVLMLPALWLFARRLFGGGLVPGCCAALLAADFMHFTQTRIATIDSYAVFFILLMYAFFWLWLSEGSLPALALSGLCFGLGAATKWICLYASLGLGFAWLCRWIGAFVNSGSKPKGANKAPKKKGTPHQSPAATASPQGEALLSEFFKNVAFCLVFFVLIPALIYCLSYLPYAAPRGVRPFSGAYFRMVWDNQVYMFRYHAGVDATHPYSSRWYQWMLDIRPILYYLKYYPDNVRSSFGAWLNPILCWSGLLALFVLGYTAVFRRDRKAAFLLLGYFAQLSPWLFITRITFAYHYFACSLFLVLALGYVFSLMREAGVPGWRARAVGLCALSAAVFALFYPAVSGALVDNTLATGLLKWLPTWPFVRMLP